MEIPAISYPRKISPDDQMMPCELSKTYVLIYGQQFETIYHSRKPTLSSYTVTEKNPVS